MICKQKINANACASAFIYVLKIAKCIIFIEKEKFGRN